ncbi:aspartate carbamoyltransferase [Tessaracoccus aquimaris]|uniref:Aspartate carbamoyltransferase n=1 Tax=Tessaracoccus aquimaris TaxID=1332264 RepID=A0A1Q2CK72_9ACTN|nr:aspartate carbamoyltransferase catalytic subunit [Tessaracoccus aquimaris]AQP46528.1 aspartate carbamoyltransferase [Tessaracoccus aquimaris]
MKHLLGIADLSRDEIETILATAEEMHDVQSRPIKKLPALRGRTVVNLFFEDSTRTRSSFELAAKWLSADAINVSAKGSSVSKGESMRDTLMTLDAMGVDAIIMRHAGSGSVQQAAGWVRASMINAGDGMHEHPTQALLDAHAIRRHLRANDLGDIEGKRVSITGDLLHSRVVRSNVLLLQKLGASVVLVAPPTLLPPGVENWGVEVTYDLDEVLPEVDVAMMLRVQRERMSGGFFPSEREYIAGYGLTAQRLTRLKPGACIAHPGPMNRGLEISSAAADASQSIILDQVSSGVAVRMSVLYHLLAGNTGSDRRD